MNQTPKMIRIEASFNMKLMPAAQLHANRSMHNIGNDLRLATNGQSYKRRGKICVMETGRLWCA
jgi:hypothetical protein